MASVRASLMTQARRAAQRIDARAAEPGPTNPAVEQLVRCAQLSEDAAHTLEWALETLRAHATNHADTTACQLLRAARARLETAGVDADTAVPATDGSESLAWR